MPKQPTPHTDDRTDDATDDTIGGGIHDAINPTAPEAFEDKAQALVGNGIAASSLVVKVYRADGATAGTPGKYVGTVNYADFGDELLAQRYGPGMYVAHLQSTDNRARGTLKVARLEIDQDARGASLTTQTAAARIAPTSGGGDMMQMLLVQMMQSNQQTQIEAMKQQTAMMQALAARPAPDMTPVWSAMISTAPQLFEMLSKRGGSGSTLGQVRELLDYIEDRRGDKPADESPLKWIMETIVPAFMQAMNKPGDAQTTAAPRPALPAANPRPAQPAPTKTEQPTPSAPASAAAAPSEAQQSGQREAGTAPDQTPDAMQPLIHYANAVAPMLRAAGLLPDPDLEQFAETAYEMAHAFGVVEMFDDQTPVGTLAQAMEALHEDLKPLRESVLIPIEQHLRRFVNEDRAATQDAQNGQLRLGNEIDNSSTAQKRLDALAKARAAKAAKQARTSQEGPTP